MTPFTPLSLPTRSQEFVEPFRLDPVVARNIRATVAPRDVALRGHQRDVLFALGTNWRNPEIVAQRNLLEISDFRLDFAVHLIFVKQTVHQALLLGMCGKEWALVDGGANLLGRFLARFTDPPHQVAVQIVNDAGQHLLGLRAHVGPREHVAEILVFAGVLDLYLLRPACRASS